MPNPRHKLAAITLAACVLVAGGIGLFTLFSRGQAPHLERIQDSGVLVVAIRRSPASYFASSDGPDGFEHALIEQFADALGVETRYQFPPTLGDLLDTVARGEVHMAAGGLTIAPQRMRWLHFSIPYDQAKAQLIYRRGDERPQDLNKLAPGDVHIVAGSSHAETMVQLTGQTTSNPTWVERESTQLHELLTAVVTGEIRSTVTDDREFALSRRHYPYAAVALDIGEAQPVAWAFPRQSDGTLRDAADRFLSQIAATGELEGLKARYFGHAGRLNFVDMREFWRDVRDRLPRYRPLFEQAGEQTEIDWRLLAAIAYQESHWEPEAVSPTGVRGIMMLTQATAEQMGITDRQDPAQSIIGGAKYLGVVDRKIPPRITDPDRLWFALAGYNVGFGHLEDARILTQRDGADPDLWREVKKRLPLLAQKKHHQTVQFGFARGGEPVDYVDNIRNYYDMLIWFTTTADDAARSRLLAGVPANSVTE